MKRRLHPDLEITGIVPCLYDSRLRLAREVLGEIRRYFPGRVFRQAIGTNVKLAEAPSFGKTIFEYAPESAGARDYGALAGEVLAQEAPEESQAPDASGLDEAQSPTSAPRPAALGSGAPKTAEEAEVLREMDLAPEPPPAPAPPSPSGNGKPAQQQR